MTTALLPYSAIAPTRAEVDALPGATLLEFGTAWCTHCQATLPLLTSAMARHPGVRHLRIEDGQGRALGRSYRVKLWPTLIFLNTGVEVARLVRPTDAQTIVDALADLDALA